MNPTLFDLNTVGKARKRDRYTAIDAAKHAPACEDEILVLLENHPNGLTDDELVSLLPTRYPPSVKTARSRLVGWENQRVIDSGERRMSNRGAPMCVWKLNLWAPPIVDVPVTDAL